MAPRLVQAYEPDRILIDEADTGESFFVNILVKRLTIKEKATYDRLRFRLFTPEAERLVLVRRTDEERERAFTSTLSLERLREVRQAVATVDPAEALSFLKALVEELVPTDEFVMPDEEIRRRRLLEMTPDERARYDRLREQDQEAYAEFLAEALRQFVRVPEGQLLWQDEDGGDPVPVTNGEQLARCYGSRSEVLRQISASIMNINSLTEAQKKTWRSRFDSKPSSQEPSQAIPGVSPDPIAAPASDSGSATTEAATAIEAGPSGVTARS